jgi:hypothetical protein
MPPLSTARSVPTEDGVAVGCPDFLEPAFLDEPADRAARRLGAAKKPLLNDPDVDAFRCAGGSAR